MTEALTLLAILVLAAPPCSAQVKGSSEDERAIRELDTEFVAAWNMHDAKTLSMFWTEEGHYTGGWGCVTGHAEIATLFAKAHSTFLKEARLTSTVGAIRFVKPEVAVVEGTFRTIGVHDRRGAELPPVRGTWTWVVAKKNGKWWIVADHVMPLLSDKGNIRQSDVDGFRK